MAHSRHILRKKKNEIAIFAKLGSSMLQKYCKNPKFFSNVNSDM
jgi:hypothetical protein